MRALLFKAAFLGALLGSCFVLILGSDSSFPVRLFALMVFTGLGGLICGGLGYNMGKKETRGEDLAAALHAAMTRAEQKL